MSFFTEPYFWLIIIGIILVIISIIVLSLYGSANAWYWILFSIGTTLFSTGFYFWLQTDSRRRREKFEKDTLIQAIAYAESIGEHNAAYASTYASPEELYSYVRTNPDDY